MRTYLPRCLRECARHAEQCRAEIAQKCPADPVLVPDLCALDGGEDLRDAREDAAHAVEHAVGEGLRRVAESPEAQLAGVDAELPARQTERDKARVAVAETAAEPCFPRVPTIGGENVPERVAFTVGGFPGKVEERYGAAALWNLGRYLVVFKIA